MDISTIGWRCDQTSKSVSFSDKTAEQQEFALTTNNQRLQLQPREMEGLLLSQHLQMFFTLDLFPINQ